MTGQINELDHGEAERLCLDAIDALELLALGETVGDVLTADLATGLALYAQLLETTLYLTRGSTPGDTRAAARITARAWRTRVPT